MTPGHEGEKNPQNSKDSETYKGYNWFGYLQEFKYPFCSIPSMCSGGRGSHTKAQIPSVPALAASDMA